MNRQIIQPAGRRKERIVIEAVFQPIERDKERDLFEFIYLIIMTGYAEK